MYSFYNYLQQITRDRILGDMIRFGGTPEGEEAGVLWAAPHGSRGGGRGREGHELLVTSSEPIEYALDIVRN
jgi:hypothetical protein